MNDSWKPDTISAADLMDYEFSPDEKKSFREGEQRYRSGYVHGVIAALEELDAGHKKRSIYNWACGKLNDWRYSNCDALVLPPTMRKKK